MKKQKKACDIYNKLKGKKGLLQRFILHVKKSGVFFQDSFYTIHLLFIFIMEMTVIPKLEETLQTWKKKKKQKKKKQDEEKEESKT